LVKEVRGKRLPELTDEFVDDVTELESVGELREQIEKNVLSWKVESTRRQFQDQVVEAIVADLDLELPEALIEAEVEARVRDLLHRLEHQNLSIDDYLRATGMDEQQFIVSVREQAVASLSTRVLLDGVIAIDGIEVADGDYQEAVESLAASSGSDVATVEAALSEGGQDQALTSDILRRKALERIVEAATPVDADGNPVDLTPVLVDEETVDEETLDEATDEEAPGQDESLDPEGPAAQNEE
jgi:trigger factor